MNEKEYLCIEKIKLKEYELVENVMYNGTSSQPSEQWNKQINSILRDHEYQKVAIKLEKNDMGITTLVGIITPSFMFVNHADINSDILEELIHNILFNYVDKDKKLPIMFVKDIFGISYITHMLIQPNLILKDCFQEKITEGILMLYSKKCDKEIIKCFLTSPAIAFKYKKSLLEKMNKEELFGILCGLKEDIDTGIYRIMSEIDDDEFDFENFDDEEEEIGDISCFDEVLNYINERIEE